MLPIVHRKNERGFTLLEILIALTILGMAVTVIIQLASANSRSIMAADGYTKAALEAETRIREVLDKKPLPEGQWSEQTENGYMINYTVTEVLDQRTEGLPLRLLRIDLVLSENGATRPPLTVRSLKVVERPAADGNPEKTQ